MKQSRQKFDLHYDMKQVRKELQSMQIKIATATRNKDWKTVHEQANSLIQSEATRVCAIINVLSNTGIRSPGLGKESFHTNKDYEKMIHTLKHITLNPEKYKSTALDRIHIPKKDRSKTRPISIPSYTDRCLQALYKFALEPYAEELMDPSSYGFRPIVNCQWAAARCYAMLTNQNAKYESVISLDIQGCYDNISHIFLEKYIPIIPSNILKEWLKSGYIERGNDFWQETLAGVPQGDIISPLLANMTLDGLEYHIIRNKAKYRLITAKSKYPGSGLVRYADDIIIFCQNHQESLYILERTQEFLQDRGLQINNMKTKLIDTNKDFFTFVGYEFQKVFRLNRKRKTPRIFIPNEAIKTFRQKMKDLKDHPNQSVENYIQKANLILRGWGNYYCFTHNSRTKYHRLDYWIWNQYYHFCLRKTQIKYDKLNYSNCRQFTLKKYFFQEKHILSPGITTEKDKKELALMRLSSIKISTAKYSNSNRNPFIVKDSQAMFTIQNSMKNSFREKVLQKHNYRCSLCDANFITNPIAFELHHIRPIQYNGENNIKNLIPLCKSPCHKRISTAVQRKDKKEIQKYFQLGLLDVPMEL